MKSQPHRVFARLFLGLGAALSVGSLHAAQAMTPTYRQPAWQVRVRKDRFTGQVTCRVFRGSAGAPSVAYARQSLAFRFSSRLSTLRADFRVDGDHVASWTSIYPTLVENGATLPGASLDNPTGGLVILPISVLAGGHVVTVRPTPKSRLHVFAIDGLSDALARARLLGCASDGDFVR